jgi:hypothetical protein
MRLPYYVRGPGIPAGQSRNEVVLNIGMFRVSEESVEVKRRNYSFVTFVVLDVAPTILELAGLTSPDWMDGVSFAPLLTTNNSAIEDYPSRFVSF